MSKVTKQQQLLELFDIFTFVPSMQVLGMVLLQNENPTVLLFRFCSFKKAKSAIHK